MNEKITKCPMCSAPIDYLESGAIRFDSSKYHAATAKILSELSANKGHVADLIAGVERATRVLDEILAKESS